MPVYRPKHTSGSFHVKSTVYFVLRFLKGLSLPDSRFGTCETYDLWIRGYIHLHKIKCIDALH